MQCRKPELNGLRWRGRNKARHIGVVVKDVDVLIGFEADDKCAFHDDRDPGSGAESMRNYLFRCPCKTSIQSGLGLDPCAVEPFVGGQ